MSESIDEVYDLLESAEHYRDAYKELARRATEAGENLALRLAAIIAALNPERLFEYWEGSDIPLEPGQTYHQRRRLHDWELEGAANFEEAQRLAAEWYRGVLNG